MCTSGGGNSLLRQRRTTTCLCLRLREANTFSHINTILSQWLYLTVFLLYSIRVCIILWRKWRVAFWRAFHWLRPSHRPGMKEKEGRKRKNTWPAACQVYTICNIHWLTFLLILLIQRHLYYGDLPTIGVGMIMLTIMLLCIYYTIVWFNFLDMTQKKKASRCGWQPHN